MVARVVTVNVFLSTIFTYQNRIFFMPARILKEVENTILNFICPMPWLKLGFLCVVKSLYGISCELVDIRSANVAAVLATHERCEEVRQGVAASLSRWRRRWTRLAHPALSWSTAFDYYRHASKKTYADTLAAVRRRRRDTTKINEYKVLYDALRGAELENWTGYLEARVGAKGWDQTLLVQNLRRLPRSVPQGHRWFLLKLHLNAPMTTARASAAGRAEIENCCFCGAACGDSLPHMTGCGLVLSVCDQLFAAGRMPSLSNAHPVLMMQSGLDGSSIAAVIAVFASVWRVRATCRSIGGDMSQAALFGLVSRCLECPWLVRCMPTCDRKTRRQGRMRPPAPAPERTIYRSDGASRGQGIEGTGVAGWGAAVWQPTAEGYGEGPSHATACGFLGHEVSNNVAEYIALRACLLRAVRLLEPHVVFQVDSLLVSRQLARYNAWACRSAELIPLRDECRRLGAVLNDAAVIWEVRHIYREFNQTADSLANQGVDCNMAQVSTDTW